MRKNVHQWDRPTCADMGCGNRVAAKSYHRGGIEWHDFCHKHQREHDRATAEAT